MLGLPDSSTPMAACATADSTQPPLTDPTVFPVRVIAIFAPSPRGAEPSTLMTVASAICSPSWRQRSIVSLMSFMGISNLWGVSSGFVERRELSAHWPTPVDGAQRQDELHQALEIVGGQKVV